MMQSDPYKQSAGWQNRDVSFYSHHSRCKRIKQINTEAKSKSEVFALAVDNYNILPRATSK
jgi:hypothetical protein